VVNPNLRMGITEKEAGCLGKISQGYLFYEYLDMLTIFVVKNIHNLPGIA